VGAGAHLSCTWQDSYRAYGLDDYRRLLTVQQYELWEALFVASVCLSRSPLTYRLRVFACCIFFKSAF